MTVSRVLICNSDTILSLALESLLTADVDLQVSSSSPRDEMELLDHVAQYQPEVVVLGSSSPVAEQSMLSQLLSRLPHLWVITVSDKDNWLHIYHRQDVLLTKAADLTHLIQEI